MEQENSRKCGDGGGGGGGKIIKLGENNKIVEEGNVVKKR